MKKTILIALSMLFLAACGGNDGVKANENTVKTETGSANHENLKEFEEKSIWQKHINLETHSIQIMEDNSHKRVALFENEQGEEMYKSIFIKNTERLKIIQFDEGLLYNDII
ncbi:hypothetical protein MUO14_16610 [Halobacillus shinanisalinarum]|uniref:Uncharacterized protein n=1 Tax=Halobacillus shinanisalinarum TaxID=2932258 RepID=A0ABY4GWK4_9BACI|nr:hypothetical protein [Halobacillus shinanisalinarum]UOQ92105.1 hypothetical protein MUO14_16610 [Halobacillus shinanisalinarum]